MRFAQPPSRALLCSIVAASLSCGDSLDVPGEEQSRTGTLEVTIATMGVEPDPDGYFVQVDVDTVRRVLSGEMFRQTVSPGTHRVELSDVAANCTLESVNPQDVTAAAEETAAVGFQITCTASPRSSIQVTVTTSGDGLDPDGYGVALDDGELQLVGANDRHDFSEVTLGAHVVELSGIAPNCRVRGLSRVQVSLSAALAAVSFTIECFTAGTPGWNALALPAGIVAVGVWGSSSTDLFVTGRDSASQRGVILHYDGDRWIEQFRAGRYQGTVVGIWGTSPTDVFAAGADGLLLRYDGRQWSQFGASGLDYLQFYGVVWGSSPTNVFAGGLIDGQPQFGMVQRYDGDRWQGLPGHGFGFYGEIDDISGTSATDVYVVGTESSYDAAPDEQVQRHAITHYDGTTWTTSFESLNHWTGEEYVHLRGLWANTPNDVFAVGLSGRILHYDGHTWSPMTSPTTGDLIDLWGRSSGDVYAVGPGGVLHYDGASWSILGERPACSWGSNCLWGTATEVFVVSGAVILHGRTH